MPGLASKIFAFFLVIPIHAQTRATLDQAPSPSLGTFERALRRYAGQTHFVSAADGGGLVFFQSALGGPESMPADANGGGQRSVVDSDVFEVGPKDAKLLLLLNGRRGLMILDFADGPDKPRLRGRVPPTGNHPRDMYVDWTKNRAIVIENWQRENDDAGARILTYDLSDLSRPRVLSVLEVDGQVSDSRMVGGILYVVGDRRNSRGGGSYAKSYAVGVEGVSQIKELALQNHVSAQQNMGIQEVRGEGGRYSYYITAITYPNSSWWWSPQSRIELLDISSPTGEIRPVMTMDVQGRIEKRSWVNIHGGAVFVTSNYYPKGSRVQRVAVESFRLPTPGTEVITPDEYQIRELTVRSKVESADGVEPREKWIEKMNLRTAYVRSADGTTLHRPYSDFAPLDFGDTTGQSAQVQDVRYVTTTKGAVRAQVFWVPANEIDPLDIVDITDPAKRPEHQARLQFDGWIARSVPLAFDGREFLLGLGYIIPAVDNPEGRRLAQARLFEITRRRGKTEPVTLADVTLNQVQWSDVGSHDKLLSVTFDDATGKGAVLFMGARWLPKVGYQQGGQVVEFDLSQADAEEGAPLTEGAFVRGEEGWLKRVFTHPRLDALMTFSDRELGVFKSAPGEKLIEASARMELARDIAAFEHFPAHHLGAQIVRSGDRYGEISKTLVRFVREDQPDAERNELVASVMVSGDYFDHWTDGKQLLVVTRRERGEWTDRGHKFTRGFEAALIQVGPNGYTAVTLTARRPDAEASAEHLNTDVREIAAIRPGVWAMMEPGNRVVLIEGGPSELNHREIKLELPVEWADVPCALQMIDGRLFVIARKPLPREGDPYGSRLTENSVALVDTSDPQKWTAGGFVNIPGSPRGFVFEGDRVTGLLTSESRALDADASLREESLNVVTFDGPLAKLTAVASVGDSLNITAVAPNRWLFTDPVGAPSRYRPQDHMLGAFDVAPQTGLIHRQMFPAVKFKGEVATILKTADAGTRVVVTAGSNLHVVDLDFTRGLASEVPLKALNTFAAPRVKDERSRVPKIAPWTLPTTVYGWDTPRGAVHLTANRIHVVAGEYGICSAELVAKAPSEK